MSLGLDFVLVAGRDGGEEGIGEVAEDEDGLVAEHPEEDESGEGAVGCCQVICVGGGVGKERVEGVEEEGGGEGGHGGGGGGDGGWRGGQEGGRQEGREEGGGFL